MHDRYTTASPHSFPDRTAGPAPAPPQPVMAAAADVEKRLFELVARLQRVSGLIVSRPIPGKESNPVATGQDLSSLLRSANDSINAVFSLVNAIESDLAA